MKDQIVDAEYVRSRIHYDPDTGVMTWKTGPTKMTKIGGLATHASDKRGYLRIRMLRRLYMAHRVIWLLVHGEWPKLLIDHVNGDPGDNRLCNLREATYQQNNQNRKPRTRSLPKGVARHRTKFQAFIKHNGKGYSLGIFDTPNEAHAAYCAAAKRICGEFARVA